MSLQHISHFSYRVEHFLEQFLELGNLPLLLDRLDKDNTPDDLVAIREIVLGWLSLVITNLAITKLKKQLRS